MTQKIFQDGLANRWFRSVYVWWKWDRSFLSLVFFSWIGERIVSSRGRSLLSEKVRFFLEMEEFSNRHSGVKGLWIREISLSDCNKIYLKLTIENIKFCICYPCFWNIFPFSFFHTILSRNENFVEKSAYSIIEKKKKKEKTGKFDVIRVGVENKHSINSR